MSILVRAGDKLPLNLLLDDGATDKFVRASLFSEDDSPLGVFSLAHVSLGLYRDDSFTALLSHKRIYAVYEVFEDNAFLWPAYEYDLRTEDVFDISSESSRSAYAVCVPPKLELPLSGSKVYRFVVYVFDDAGSPTDPDGSQVSIHIEDAFNSIILADTPCQREQVGVYFFRYTVLPTDVERALWVEFTFSRGGTPFLVGQVSEAIKTDARTTSLDTKITAQRAANLDLLDAAISSRQAASVALSQFNILRSDVAGVDSRVAAVDAKLGTPATGSVSGDVAAVAAQTAKIGAPVYGTLAADHAAIMVQLAKLGIPTTGTLAGDLEALDAHLSAQDLALSSIKSDTLKIGTPPTGTLGATQQTILDALTDASGEEAVTQGMITALSTKVGTPANGTIAADLAAIADDTSTLRVRLTAQRASNLDLLDVAVSSRESEADASARYASLFAAIQGVLAGIGAIPNNTTFVGIVPPVLVLPPQPTAKTYKFFVNLFDAQGLPEDPDSGVTFRIEDVTGAIVLANTSMVRTSEGNFYCQYPVEWDDPERTLFVIFSYAKNAVPFQQTRITEVQEYESKLDLLLQRLTQTRAGNLDRLDATVSSRCSAADCLDHYTDLAGRIQAIMVEAQAIEAILGTPVISIAADLSSVHAWVSKIGTPTTTLAGDIATARAEVSAGFSQTITDLLLVLQRIADLDADLALVRTDTSRIGIPSGGTVAAALGDIRAKLGPTATTLEDLINGLNVGQLLAILGTPSAGSVSNDIRAVQTHLSSQDVALGALTAQTALVPATAAAVSALGSAVAPIMPKLELIEDKIDALGACDLSGLEVKLDALQADVDSLDTDVAAIPTNPVLANDPRLDFLDVAVSTRATPADVSGGSGGGSFMALDLVGVLDGDGDNLVGRFEDEDAGELGGSLDVGSEEIVGILEDEE